MNFSPTLQTKGLRSGCTTGAPRYEVYKMDYEQMKIDGKYDRFFDLYNKKLNYFLISEEELSKYNQMLDRYLQ